MNASRRNSWLWCSHLSRIHSLNLQFGVIKTYRSYETGYRICNGNGDSHGVLKSKRSVVVQAARNIGQIVGFARYKMRTGVISHRRSSKIIDNLSTIDYNSPVIRGCYPTTKNLSSSGLALTHLHACPPPPPPLLQHTVIVVAFPFRVPPILGVIKSYRVPFPLLPRNPSSY